jgi:hypothetical protein
MQSSQGPQANVPRCTSCGSSAVTPPSVVRGSPHGVELSVRFRRRDVKGGFFSNDVETFAVSEARACLACGHVMFVLSPEALAALRAHGSNLEAMRPEP